VFGRAAPPDWLILTPRAPLPDGDAYTWYRLDADTGRPNPASQAAAIAALGRFIDTAVPAYGGDRENVILLGFSQGAAVSMLYLLDNPTRVRGAASLAGFIPGLKDRAVPPLHGLPTLIIHGTQDETIALKFAERMRDRFQEAGAAVTYDVSDIGHKVSAQGMRTLRTWLAAFSPKGGS
jgi:phospholipase/carboxylesterase